MMKKWDARSSPGEELRRERVPKNAWILDFSSVKPILKTDRRNRHEGSLVFAPESLHEQMEMGHRW